MDTQSNSLPIIQSLWVGDTLSVMERLCISSFLQNGHPFHLYAYTDIKNVPKGTVLKDAREILSPDRIFKYKDRDTYAGFSNVFRYKLIFEKGNYWVDSDVVCLRPFDFTQKYVFSGAVERKFYNPFQSTLHIQSCVIKTPAGSEVMKYCYEVSSSKNLKEVVWGEIGPKLLETAVRKFGLDNYVVSHGAFTMINWPNWENFISNSTLTSWAGRAKIALCRSRSVHLLNEMWRLNGVDKNACFPGNCIYEYLKRRYLCDE